MDEFENDEYLEEHKRSQLIKYGISIAAALIILLITVFFAFFVNAKYTNNDNSKSSASEVSENSQTESIYEDSDNTSEISEINNSEISDISDVVSETVESQPEESIETSEPVIYGQTIDGVYLFGDVGLQVFGSSSLAETKYAAALNAYRDAFSSDIKMYSILVPTYVEFYKFTDNRVICQSQKASIDSIYSKLDNGITSVDIYTTLKDHISEYLYYRTDVNWSPLAAYYAYCEFIKEIGDMPIPLSTYETGKIDEFLGMSYIRTKAKQLEDVPDNIDFYRVDRKYPSNVTHYFTDGSVYKNSQLVFKNVAGITNGYLIFGAETQYTSIITANTTGRKLLVLRESSATAFLPFLVPHFDEIHAVDIRYFDEYTKESIADFAEEKGITDILFINYINSANTGYRIDDINKLLGDRIE
ncbi:MAG: hypothetical protein A2Y17_12635 [Clostridiales bacterium GWF2_38_85]|nr:MAG: hypothetical protein A2Y17_12635 [Clostridiales bacterium GWF2_38_85]HBL84105.1 hypothetical protein [Clostridiales bacterium]